MTLSSTTSPGPSVPSSLSFLECLLYPDGVTLQAGRIYSTPSLSPHLATRYSHLQEGHFLSATAGMCIGQRSSWQKQINTSSFQLGLEIRAQGEEAEALTGTVGVHPPCTATLAFPTKPIWSISNVAESYTRGWSLRGGCRIERTLPHFGLGRDRSVEQKCDRSKLLSQLRQVGGEGHLAP